MVTQMELMIFLVHYGTAAVNGSQDFKSDVTFGTGQNEWSFTGGVSSSSLGTDDILRGFDKFEDVDNIEVDFLIAPESIADAMQLQL